MRKYIIAALASLALFLTGCSQMNSAATVGDVEITLEALQSQVDSILAEREEVDTSQMQLESGEALTRNQLSFMISNILIDEIAKDVEIEIANSELEAYRIEIYQNIGGEEMLPSVLVNAAIAPESLDAVLRRDLILQKISAAASEAGSDDAAINQLIEGLVTEKANNLKIVINPRYGVWDSNSFAVIPAEPAGDAVTDK
ncbi:MAG: SurA N-terminal domain-containing protein [Candidatus Nanopelagicaceae bacterium]